MAPHFDVILGSPDAAFYLGRAALVHMVIGADYQDYVGPISVRRDRSVPGSR